MTDPRDVADMPATGAPPSDIHPDDWARVIDEVRAQILDGRDPLPGGPVGPYEPCPAECGTWVFLHGDIAGRREYRELGAMNWTPHPDGGEGLALYSRTHDCTTRSTP